ncbi:MAG: hypothetical protein Q7K43_06450 [Candidatus Woesearchaeota archaeon]|nr:hypothetical protein [Candidatus Woesearchaeota archaeon]
MKDPFNATFVIRSQQETGKRLTKSQKEFFEEVWKMLGWKLSQKK